MKSLLCFVVFGAALIHAANHQCWTVDQIADQIISDADVNHDGVIQLEELYSLMFTDWNLGNSTGVSYHDFITTWETNYHDTKDTAHIFFTRLDANHDNHISAADIAVQLPLYDNSPQDGQIQPAEFKAFMHAVHPDSHKHGGNPGPHCH